MNSIYHNYDFQNEMFEKFKLETEIQSHQIDSLNNLLLNFRDDTLISAQRVKLISNVRNQIENIKRENVKYKNDLNKKIYTRINTGIENYCKDQGIKVLLNNDNKTNILFRDTSIDVTNKLTSYLNREYQGI